MLSAIDVATDVKAKLKTFNGAFKLNAVCAAYRVASSSNNWPASRFR